MIVSFKFYVMNFVDFVIDCYTHITSHVTQVFARLHTLHKLLFAKHCTCYCVCLSIWPTKCEITLSFFFLCKTYFVFEILKGECLKILILGKLGLKLVFWKNISSHSYAFYSLYSMLWEVFSKTRLFFLKSCFSRILIDPICFSINRNCI